MTTAHGATSSDRPSSGIAARGLRAYLGIHNVSRLRLSMAAGIDKSTMSRKLDGRGSFTLEELVQIGDALGLPWTMVGEGIPVDAPAPTGSVCPQQGSNLRPAD